MVSIFYTSTRLQKIGDMGMMAVGVGQKRHNEAVLLVSLRSSQFIAWLVLFVPFSISLRVIKGK